MPKISPAARRALTEQRKAQILAAASKVFAAKGFERATIADIAKAAGIAEGSIYNYFKNKGDLLVSIPRQFVEPPITRGNAAIAMLSPAAPGSPEEMLTMIARNLIATMRQNAHVFRILISALPSLKPAQREKYLNQVVMYAAGTLENYFRAQIEQGVFRQDAKPPVLARAFVGMFLPFLMFREFLQIETDADWQYDDLIASLVPLFLSGLLTEAARAPKPRQKISVE